MKNKKNLFAALALSATLMVTGSLAYFSHMDSVANKLSTKGFGSDIVEEFTPKEFTPGATITKKVRVNNTGDYNLIARATWSEVWVKDGQEYGAATYPAETDVSKNGTSAKWVNGGDTWAYYNEVIEPGKHTENFLDSITLSNAPSVVGTNSKTYYFTKATTEPAPTLTSKDLADANTKWVEIEKTVFDALDSNTGSDKATFKRVVTKSNGKYDNSEYTLTVTAQVVEATKEAAGAWASPTNQAVKDFLGALPSVNK